MQIVLRNKKVSEKIKELLQEKNDLQFKQVDEEKDYTVEIESINKKIDSFENIAKVTYIAPFLSGECYKDFFPMIKKLQSIEAKELDLDCVEADINELIGFVCKLFGNQFTVDDFWKGISLENVLAEVARILNEVMAKIFDIKGEKDTQ